MSEKLHLTHAFNSINTMNLFNETPSSLLRECRTHFRDLYNYFDFLGLVLTILVIPLRFVEVNSQWSVAGLGYLLNGHSLAFLLLFLNLKRGKGFTYSIPTLLCLLFFPEKVLGAFAIAGYLFLK